MKRKLSLVNLFLILAIVIVCGLRNAKINLTVERDTMHLLTNASLGDYEVVDDNKVNCDLETFSFIVQEMVKDGYEIISLIETDKYVEVSLLKEDLNFRLHYANDNNFISICKIYEKSYIPMTYINEKLYRGENTDE